MTKSGAMNDAERLAKAEALAIVYGWCAVNRDGPREEVAYQLWREWADVAGSSYLGPKAHQELDRRVKDAEKVARAKVAR